MSDRSELFCGDAKEYLSQFADCTFGAVVADPPYGVEWSSGFRQERFDVLHNDDDNGKAAVHEILAECVRTCKQSRHLYVFGPESIVGGLKVGAPATMVWNKDTAQVLGNLSVPWAKSWEPIQFVVNQYSHGGKVGKDTPPARVRRGSVLTYPARRGGKVRHPTEKPVGLLMSLIESSTVEGDIVLDPFMGVGSTGVAAALLGRGFVGAEIDPGYYAIAEQRIADARSMREAMMNL